MNKNAVRVVSTSTVRESVGEDSVQPEPSDSFISSPHVEQVTQRALAYLVAGYPVHFSGVAGTGKTTLAFHVASKLGRPVTLVHGDDEFGSSDLVGKDSGYRKNKAGRQLYPLGPEDRGRNEKPLGGQPVDHGL